MRSISDCKVTGSLFVQEKTLNCLLFSVSAQMQLNLSGISSDNMEMYRLSFCFLLKFSLILVSALERNFSE